MADNQVFLECLEFLAKRGLRVMLDYLDHLVSWEIQEEKGCLGLLVSLD